MKPGTTISSLRDVEGGSEAATDEDVSSRAMGGRRVRVGVDEKVGSEGGEGGNCDLQGRKRLVGCKRNAFLG